MKEKKSKYDFSVNTTYRHNSGEVSITTGGTNLSNNGIIYLQPDKTLYAENVSTNIQKPNPNGGYHQESYATSTYQKGLQTDEKAGFIAYFVTDNHFSLTNYLELIDNKFAQYNKSWYTVVII